MNRYYIPIKMCFDECALNYFAEENDASLIEPSLLND